MSPRRRNGRRRGFTLLEATVALMILALSLMAIFDLNAGAVAMHAYTKKLTVATLLARSKMTDLEQELYDKGFSADDDEQSGDFSDEGFSSFKWRAKILAPRTTGVSTDKLLAAVFNVPIDGEGGDDGMAAIASMFGGGAAAPGLPPGAQPGQSPLGGALGGMAQTQMTQFLDQISKSVREVHLTVTWREGKNVETVDVVTHIVSLGPGSDRNGSATSGQTAAAGGNSSGRYMNPATGQEVFNAVPDGRGGFRDPATGQPVITYEEFLQRQSNPSSFNPRAPRIGGGLVPTPPKGF
jgi:general secretion pathway protein I